MDSLAKSERLHITIVGRRNVGKSSVISSLIGQEHSIVSEVAGTNTDPVSKAVDLFPYGPVVLVDTAGIDDEGELSEKRISKTIRAILNVDFVLVVLDAREKLSEEEIELLNYLDKVFINYIVVVNKIEFGVNQELLSALKELNETHYEVSCKEHIGFETLKRNIIRKLPVSN